LIGMLVSIAAMLYVFFATQIAWTWYVFLGSLITFVTSWAASFAFSPAVSPVGAIGPISAEED
jgi:hypothetical protein